MPSDPSRRAEPAREEKPGDPDASREARSVVLVGARGAGKTTVGRTLASRTGRRFVDCDAEIEKRESATVREIFVRHGEPRFREVESDVLAGVLEEADRDPCIVSTGGGAVLDAGNRRAMRDAGFVVYLAADAATLAERVRADATSAEGRPPLTDRSIDEEMALVLERRQALYLEVADAVVETAHRGVEPIVEEIIQRSAVRAAGD